MQYFSGNQGEIVPIGDRRRLSVSIKNFVRFVSRTCSRRGSGDDFIHPSYDDKLPRSNSYQQDSKTTKITQSTGKNTYFLSRSQQDKVRKDAESDPFNNPRKNDPKGERSRSHSIPTARDTHLSRRPRSISIDLRAPYLNENKLKLDDFLDPITYISATASKTSDVTTTSSSTITSEDSKDSKDPVLCCDKCDGKHNTDDCPYYKKKREVHIDGQKNGWKLVGGASNLPGKRVITDEYFCRLMIPT